MTETCRSCRGSSLALEEMLFHHTFSWLICRQMPAHNIQPSPGAPGPSFTASVVAFLPSSLMWTHPHSSYFPAWFICALLYGVSFPVSICLLLKEDRWWENPKSRGNGYGLTATRTCWSYQLLQAASLSQSWPFNGNFGPNWTFPNHVN